MLKKYSYFYIPLWYLLLSVILDVVMYAFMGLPMPSHYFYSLAIMIVIAALLCLTQRKWLQITITAPLFSLQVFFCAANVLCYTSLAEVFSLESFYSIYNAFVASKSGSFNVGIIVTAIGLLAAYVIGVVLICGLCKRPVVKRRIWQPLLCLTLVGVTILGNLVGYWTLPGYAVNSYLQNLSNTKFVYDTFLARETNLKTFGTYSYYFNNLLNLCFGKTSPIKALNLNLTDAPEPDAFEYDTIAQVPEGTNLIMILMETFERAAVNPITTPNLYNFMREKCLDVNGYYSIERTCVTDYISQTGMHALGQEMWSNYGNVSIPFSLANIFNRADYVTSAFHNYDGGFYNRDKFFPQALGFQNFYDYHVLSNQFNSYFNGNRDEDLFKENLTRIAPADQNFYSYVISISTHGISSSVDTSEVYGAEFAYIDQHLDELAPYFPWLTSPKASERQAIKNYLAGSISFDTGFGALLKYLQETEDKKNPGKKLIETTAIVMFGDHYYYMNPYAVNPENDNPNALNGNRSPFIIYNPANPVGQTITRFTATMDIYKTVCSLFGIVTDRQITYGNSVFTSAPTIGVGYLNGRVWGGVGADAWTTTDFVHFDGAALTAAEIAAYGQQADAVFLKVITDMVLLKRNGFQDLAKCQYNLPWVKVS